VQGSPHHDSRRHGSGGRFPREALSFHLLQYLIGLIRALASVIFLLEDGNTPVGLLVCNNSAANLLVCDVQVLATLVMDNTGVDSATSGTFAGQLLNAGEPMSCGGRTVRSFTAEAAVVCLHTVDDSKADCGLPCAWEKLRYGHPQLLLLRVRRVACDAVQSRPRITAYGLASTIWQIVHPLRRRRLANMFP
jgi:hypothetical protein